MEGKLKAMILPEDLLVLRLERLAKVREGVLSAEEYSECRRKILTEYHDTKWVQDALALEEAQEQRMRVNDLAALAKLHDQGHLTGFEFAAAKRQILPSTAKQGEEQQEAGDASEVYQKLSPATRQELGAVLLGALQGMSWKDELQRRIKKMIESKTSLGEVVDPVAIREEVLSAAASSLPTNVKNDVLSAIRGAVGDADKESKLLKYRGTRTKKGKEGEKRPREDDSATGAGAEVASQDPATQWMNQYMLAIGGAQWSQCAACYTPIAEGVAECPHCHQAVNGATTASLPPPPAVQTDTPPPPPPKPPQAKEGEGDRECPACGTMGVPPECSACGSDLQ